MVDGSAVAVVLEYCGHAGDGVGGDLGVDGVVGLEHGHAIMILWWRPRLSLSRASTTG